MTFSADHLAPYLSQLRQAKRCHVAYSGGLDSHVLLHSLVQLMGAELVTAVHINHQLSENAEAWEQHCQQQCEHLGVKLISETVAVEASGQGIEQAAREARYAVFKQLLQQGDLLLMAHHADDQVETVLYRLLRGSGVRGLSGMPKQRALGAGSLLRPLLPYRRSELEDYARQEKLCWVDDESNFAIDFDRNFLRHQVVPALAGRWQDYAERISHSASLCDEANGLLDAVAANDLDGLNEKTERWGWSIALPEFLDLSPARRASLLRYWAGVKGLSLPGHRILDAVEHELLLARIDAVPLVAWSGAELRRFNERLYLMNSLSNSSPKECKLKWNMDSSLRLPSDGVLFAEVVEIGSGLKVSADHCVTVSFRQGGERCHPQGRSGSNTLKKLLQEARLEPWLRDIVPLVFVDDELAAVADLWICEGFQVASDETGTQLSWRLD